MVRRLVGQTLAVASAYWLTATAGLTWAVPPGYATLIWPPAGIALGCVYVWGWCIALGVGLGSYLANVWVPSAPDRPLVFFSGALPAIGAAAQAIIGAEMMHRFLGGRARAHWAVGFVLIATASSMVNSSWGSASLMLAGLIPPEEMRESFLTWWVGDTIGCALFTPLVLFLAHNGRRREETGCFQS